MIDLVGIAVRVELGTHTLTDVQTLVAEAERLAAELAAALKKIEYQARPCVWVYLGSGSWWTGCKHETDAKYKVCQFCGHPLEDGGYAGPDFDPWSVAHAV